jgi:AmmeMemoRadiSam system protein B
MDEGSRIGTHFPVFDRWRRHVQYFSPSGPSGYTARPTPTDGDVMPDQEPKRPGRIIIPGQESEPETPRGAGLVGGGGAPEKTPSETGSRIILPPGVSREEPEDLPEFPRLRPLMLMPVKDGERELIVVNDPLGVIPGQPVLAMEALALMQLFDGQTSITDISAALMRENKDIRMGNMVRDFVAQLDEMLMLESPRFEKAYQALRDEYHPLEIRHAMFAGRSYPAEPDQLKPYLDAQFTAAAEREAADDALPGDGARPRAVMAPHLDPRRTGATIAQSILPLGDHTGGPLRVIVLGTGHSLFDDLYAITRKHFDTPLGRVKTDTAFVDAMAARIGPQAYRGELAHREEHSIEFAALYLRHRLGDRVKIVPVLIGGFHHLIEDGKTPADDPDFQKLLVALRETTAEQGGETVYLGSVDFSHVGPRFGDPSVDERTQGEVEKIDRDAIDAARKADAETWFSTIAAHQDSTRICGLAPTYVMLDLLRDAPARGRLLHYEKSAEPDSTFVSVAAMEWR